MQCVIAVLAQAAWTELGSIAGPGPGSRFGGRVAVNADATRVVTYSIDTTHGPGGDATAIHPSVYAFNGSAYLPLHTIASPYASTSRTYSLVAGVAMSGDGQVVAVGNGVDAVSVYRENTDAHRWDVMSNVNSTTATDEFGRAIALPFTGLDTVLTSGGMPLVVGMPDHDADDDAPTDRGALGAYRLSLSAPTATQLSSTTLLTSYNFGTDVSYAWAVTDQTKVLVTSFASLAITGTVYTSTDGGATLSSASGSFTTSCASGDDGIVGAISGDGLSVALGCPAGFGDYGDGFVELFVWDGANYVANATFAGTATAQKFGSSVSLSSNGTTLAIGSDGTGTSDTVVYVGVYDLGASWALRTAVTGPSLEASSAAYGIQARVSADGSTLVIGIPGHGAGTEDSYGAGLLKMYAWRTPSPPPSSSSSSSDKHSDAVLGGSIGGAIAGTLLLGTGAYFAYARYGPRQGTFAPMVGQGSGFTE